MKGQQMFHKTIFTSGDGESPDPETVNFSRDTRPPPNNEDEGTQPMDAAPCTPIPDRAFESINMTALPPAIFLVDHRNGQVIIRTVDKQGYLTGQSHLSVEQTFDLAKWLVVAARKAGRVKREPVAFTMSPHDGLKVLAGKDD